MRRVKNVRPGTAMGVMMIANNYFNDILDVTPDKLV